MIIKSPGDNKNKILCWSEKFGRNGLNIFLPGSIFEELYIPGCNLWPVIWDTEIKVSGRLDESVAELTEIILWTINSWNREYHKFKKQLNYCFVLLFRWQSGSHFPDRNDTSSASASAPNPDRPDWALSSELVFVLYFGPSGPFSRSWPGWSRVIPCRPQSRHRHINAGAERGISLSQSEAPDRAQWPIRSRAGTGCGRAPHWPQWSNSRLAWPGLISSSGRLRSRSATPKLATALKIHGRWSILVPSFQPSSTFNTSYDCHCTHKLSHLMMWCIMMMSCSAWDTSGFSPLELCCLLLQIRPRLTWHVSNTGKNLFFPATTGVTLL